MKKSKRAKKSKVKKFKGCLKMPLNVSLGEEELLRQSVWYDDWKTKGKLIFSDKRKFFINIYMTLLDGRTSLITHRTSGIHETSMKPVLAYVLDTLDIPEDIDWDKSYLTISC